MDESSPEYQKIADYINAHPTMVVGTINDNGAPHASVVYGFLASHHTVCFITRNLTRKYQNIYQRPDVSLAIYDPHDNSTLQGRGKAFISNDDHMLNFVKEQAEKINAIRADSLPPVEKLTSAGDYVLIGIELKHAKLTEYQGIGAMGEPVITDIYDQPAA